MSQLRRFCGAGLVWPELSILLRLPMPRNINPFIALSGPRQNSNKCCVRPAPASTAASQNNIYSEQGLN